MQDICMYICIFQYSKKSVCPTFNEIHSNTATATEMKEVKVDCKIAKYSTYSGFQALIYQTTILPSVPAIKQETNCSAI